VGHFLRILPLLQPTEAKGMAKGPVWIRAMDRGGATGASS